MTHMTEREEIKAFAAFAALAYHEARNVRHLVQERVLDRAPYRQLIDGLPQERKNAWRQMQRIRRHAAAAATAACAEDVFRQSFGLSLAGVASLSQHPGWKDNAPGRGGNQWAAIAEAVIELRDAIDGGRDERVSELIQRIRRMQHNTGRVGEKLDSLDASLAEAGSPE